MRLTHMVANAGCASKLGPGQLSEVIGKLPPSTNPNLLVGFDHRDDAGVFRISENQALVQTVDFFTPIVDDPYAYGQIAAANALSDVYAMGGEPLTVLNIACFTPAAAPPDVWAAVLQGAHDKTVEAGAVVVGGHSIDDERPKFGMAVTGLVDPARMFANTEARVGDRIFLTKPLGTGIVTTAAKADACSDEELGAAVLSMSRLNRDARDWGLAANVRCATDITGFSLVGHLFNIARASQIAIRLSASAWPSLPGLPRMIAEDMTTGGAGRNRAFLGDALQFDADVEPWLQALAVDPQTSGGLALFSRVDIPGAVEIGSVVEGPPSIRVVA